MQQSLVVTMVVIHPNNGSVHYMVLKQLGELTEQVVKESVVSVMCGPQEDSLLYFISLIQHPLKQ